MSKYWFKPKGCGWGFGMPICWEGWVAMLVFMAILLGLGFFAGLFSPDMKLGGFSLIVVPLTALALSLVFCFILRDKVEGGLKWRWGKKE